VVYETEPEGALPEGSPPFGAFFVELLAGLPNALRVAGWNLLLRSNCCDSVACADYFLVPLMCSGLFGADISAAILQKLTSKALPGVVGSGQIAPVTKPHQHTPWAPRSKDQAYEPLWPTRGEPFPIFVLFHQAHQRAGPVNSDLMSCVMRCTVTGHVGPTLLQLSLLPQVEQYVRNQTRRTRGDLNSPTPAIASSGCASNEAQWCCDILGLNHVMGTTPLHERSLQPGELGVVATLSGIENFVLSAFPTETDRFPRTERGELLKVLNEAHAGAGSSLFAHMVTTHIYSECLGNLLAPLPDGDQ